MNPRKAIAVARKEFRQIARDRRSLLVLLFVPAFFLLLYGYALNFDVQHIHLAVEDGDETAASRKVISAFVNSGYFDLVAGVRSAAEYERLIDRGDVRAALVIPPGLERRILSGHAGLPLTTRRLQLPTPGSMSEGLAQKNISIS